MYCDWVWPRWLRKELLLVVRAKYNTFCTYYPLGYVCLRNRLDSPPPIKEAKCSGLPTIALESIATGSSICEVVWEGTITSGSSEHVLSNWSN